MEITGDCVLCEGQYKNYGHNPAPLKDKGRCCDSCNSQKVIPVRLNNAN